MEIWKHALLSSILATLIYPFYGWGVLLILVGGVLIDIDHYLWYMLKYQKFNLSSCYKHFTIDADKNNYKDVTGTLMIFHTTEFFLLMIVASFYNRYVFLFTIGLLGHYLLDFIWHWQVTKRVITDLSVIHWLFKNQIQKL
ncbi:hypothetical protein J4448_07040 [Candidatus Woesearchaeota archaeon]|nr:hypothetical protein [Candidatus Woesearchaeota archaeon]